MKDECGGRAFIIDSGQSNIIEAHGNRVKLTGQRRILRKSTNKTDTRKTAYCRDDVRVSYSEVLARCA